MSTESETDSASTNNRTADLTEAAIELVAQAADGLISVAGRPAIPARTSHPESIDNGAPSEGVEFLGGVLSDAAEAIAGVLG